MKSPSRAGDAQQVDRARTGAEDAPRAFYSVEKFAGAIGVGEMSVYRAIHAGRLPAIKFGGRYLVPAKALENLIEVAMTAGALVDIENATAAARGGGAP